MAKSALLAVVIVLVIIGILAFHRNTGAERMETRTWDKRDNFVKGHFDPAKPGGSSTTAPYHIPKYKHCPHWPAPYYEKDERLGKDILGFPYRLSKLFAMWPPGEPCC